MGRGGRVTHPLPTQARSLSAQISVLELGETCWRWGWLSTSPRTRKQVEHPALTTQAGWLTQQTAHF